MHANQVRLLPLYEDETGFRTNISVIKPLPTPVIPDLPDLPPEPDQSGKRLLRHQVIIIRGAYKGHIGTVEDEAGECVRVRLDTYSATNPWRQVLVKGTCCDLLTENAYIQAHKKSSRKLTRPPERDPTPTPSSDTHWITDPPISSSSSSTSALSPPPLASTSMSPPASTSSPLPPIHHANAWILDEKFLSVPVRATINSRDHKVQQMLVDGKRVVQRKVYKAMKSVDLDSLLFTHPSKRDFGRFLIIRGEYRGSQARPMSWTEGASDELIFVVTIVESQGEGEPDRERGPELTLSSHDLILGWETPKDRKANAALAKRLKREILRPQLRVKG